MTMAEPIALVDTLNSLLEATLGSVFRFMDESSPYLTRATVEVRRPLAAMVRAEEQRARELAETIDRLGGTPLDGQPVREEEQYLAYLSLKFLLPKLVNEKTLQIQRYENALKSVLRENAEVGRILERHVGQMLAELGVLERAAGDVIANSRAVKEG